MLTGTITILTKYNLADAERTLVVRALESSRNLATPRSQYPLPTLVEA